jgi:predicted Rossmann fold flavoprotein
VLDALLGEADRLGVTIASGQRVNEVAAADDRFVVRTDAGLTIEARAVVLATGGRSLPKSGSDGFGYQLAARLGHGHVTTTPALAPLTVAEECGLSGVSHRVMLTLRVDHRPVVQLDGPLLWTHFGISGPVALNLSRHWHRAEVDAQPASVLLNLLPGETFESVETWWLEQERLRPRARVATVLATRVPSAVAVRWIERAGLAADATMAHLDRHARRRLVHTIIETVVPVTGSRGYTYAEVTAGGVPLDEIDAATMESRRCPRLYLVGEILDVDGRLGGFNFQWAWSSAWVAARSIARAIGASSPNP